MLVLRRTEGQWIEVMHRSGARLRFRTYAIRDGRVLLAFDDPERNFAIQRSERLHGFETTDGMPLEADTKST